MSSSDPDKAWNSFYLEYGAAMFAWQLIESELATLFFVLSRIPADMAIGTIIRRESHWQSRVLRNDLH
jgi:hypothetical protein